MSKYFIKCSFYCYRSCCLIDNIRK